MNEFYYNVNYIEYQDGKIANNGAMLIRSTLDLTTDDFKRFIRSQIRKPQAVLTISKIDKLDKSAYVTLGGDEKAPWFR